MTTPLQEFLNEPDVMAFEDIEPITVKVGHIDDFTMDIGDLRDAASNEAKIDALIKRMSQITKAAERIKGYATEHMRLDACADEADFICRLVEDALSSHTEQEGGGRG